LYSVVKFDTEKAMYKPTRYVFRPARPAPALLRRIWAWFWDRPACLGPCPVSRLACSQMAIHHERATGIAQRTSLNWSCPRDLGSTTGSTRCRC